MPDSQCQECLVGRCRPAVLPYIRLFGPHMIVLPNGPASKCDMCGHVDFQPRFLVTMQIMLEEIAKDQRKKDLKAQRAVSSGRTPLTPAGRGGLA